MCCQVLLDHIFSCDIMSNSHRLVQVMPGVQCAQHWHVWNLSLRLLQCIAIIRLPSDTFARRQLTVTLFVRSKFSLQVSNKYSIFKFLVFIRVVSTIHVASTQELYEMIKKLLVRIKVLENNQ